MFHLACMYPPHERVRFAAFLDHGVRIRFGLEHIPDAFLMFPLCSCLLPDPFPNGRAFADARAPPPPPLTPGLRASRTRRRARCCACAARTCATRARCSRAWSRPRSATLASPAASAATRASGSSSARWPARSAAGRPAAPARRARRSRSAARTGRWACRCSGAPPTASSRGGTVRALDPPVCHETACTGATVCKHSGMFRVLEYSEWQRRLPSLSVSV